MIAILLSIILPSIVIATARMLFRYFIRADTFTHEADKCECGYFYIHSDYACHRKIPCPKEMVATIALFCGLVFPLALVFALIMYDAPQSRRGLEERNKELEKELGMR